MASSAKPVREVSFGDGKLPDEMLRATRPYIVRGLAANWPLVRRGRESAESADAYLRQFYRDATVNAMLGSPQIRGRFFYNDTITGFNFQNVRARLDQVLDELAVHRKLPEPGAIYVGSTSIDGALPGLRAANDVDLGERKPLASIWIGNRTVVATHYDLPDNLAVVAVGERRFTLFPPDQLKNLYVGPLDFNPAGQAISLVDVRNPDFDRFPRYAEALQHAEVAEMGPGDALFIPSMWWHHVEALSPFNVLVNYWWRRSPAWMDSPMNALMLALMSLRDLPPHERDAWRDIFEHYVFAPDASTADHIPDAARRVLGPLDANTARELRARLLKRLNR